MTLKTTCTTLIISCAITAPAQSQEKFQSQLCEAAKTNRIVELIYDKDVSKGCIPRLLDVHQVAIGHNESLYVHGWQTRGWVIPPFLMGPACRTMRPFSVS